MHQSSPATRRTSLAYTPTSSAQLLADMTSRMQRTSTREQQTAEDLIFDLFKLPNRDEASIGKLLTVLKGFGLHEDDPRLRPMMEKVRMFESDIEERLNETKDPKHWKLKRSEFKKCISESVVLISQALQNNLIVPSWSQFTSRIREIYHMNEDFEQFLESQIVYRTLLSKTVSNRTEKVLCEVVIVPQRRHR
ncbi:hypothetical protein L596_002243 [Steinernema carpocapsae]|uniref:Glutaminase EF-hand domain-containing protein n=1 Tax=Steinernema carpocapsae TaxID=34508 RepID=A0A4U8URB7_STECR|nr:hypothetical protein L596_002243 [Steinernema carpocapsae]